MGAARDDFWQKIWKMVREGCGCEGG